MGLHDHKEGTHPGSRSRSQVTKDNDLSKEAQAKDSITERRPSGTLGAHFKRRRDLFAVHF